MTALIPDVESQLGAADHGRLVALLEQLDAKRARNAIRSQYYDMKNVFRDLGIAVPPQLRNLEAAMEWPSKAVDLLARRVHIEKFVLPGGEVADWGIPEIAESNRLDVVAPQAHVSALIHTPAFFSVTLGDVASGEPEVLWTVQDASAATGEWDSARRGLRTYVAILQSDQIGPSRILYLTPTEAMTLNRVGSGNRWDVRRVTHGLGRVPVEPLTYRPRLERPFGSSRISRAIMSIADAAMRTVVRSEVGAEFFSAPQRYILDSDESMFTDADGNPANTWSMIMGRVMGVPSGTDPDTGERLPSPTVGQFPQTSMQPHSEQFRLWAERFSSASSIPLASLGVHSDSNPSSAEAQYASKEDLIMEAEACVRDFKPAYVRSMLTSIQIRDNLIDIPTELRSLGVHHSDPATPSQASRTDSVIKQIQMGVIPADSEVALEALGYDQTVIQRIIADRRRAEGGSLLDRVLPAMSGANERSPAETAAEDATAMKAKFDALGVAIRAGVDPDNASRLLGLDGIAFTGATPASLRLPERDAIGLEDK